MKHFIGMQQCPKCKAWSGDNWGQCGGKCPVKGSPHFDRATFEKYGPIRPVEKE